jgi:hypothetical protein
MIIYKKNPVNKFNKSQICNRIVLVIQCLFRNLLNKNFTDDL